MPKKLGMGNGVGWAGTAPPRPMTSPPGLGPDPFGAPQPNRCPTVGGDGGRSLACAASLPVCRACSPLSCSPSCGERRERGAWQEGMCGPVASSPRPRAAALLAATWRKEEERRVAGGLHAPPGRWLAAPTRRPRATCHADNPPLARCPPCRPSTAA